MKLELGLNGRTMEVEFSASNGEARLSFDGKITEATIAEPEPGLFIVIIKNRVYRCLIENEREITVNGRRIQASIQDKKRLRSKDSDGAGGGRANLASPMPGKVVKLLLNVGDEVAANQGVLIVEAMKMQNEVQSPRAGKVAEIRVAEGQTVNGGETLVVIE